MLRKILIALLAVLVIGGGVVAWLAWPDKAQRSVAEVTGQRPRIDAPREQTLPTVGVADVVGWQNGARPVPAAGLQVAAFATGLDHPRWLYRLPNGDVLVAESNSPAREGGGITGWVMGKLLGRAGAGVASANRITLLRDADGDGVAEVKTPFLTGLNSPFGMSLAGGYLYVGNTDALVRVPYKDGDTRITARPERVVKLPGGGNHWARNVLASPDGKLVYVSVGSSSNIAENGIAAEKYRGDILEVQPATKTARIFAAGLRNPNGMAFEPQTGRLWTVVNERDMIGSDGPPDYLTAVEFGDHFGWPWYYWGGYPDRRVDPPNPALQEYSKRPDYALGPHVAALGLSFANDAKLGQRFARGAFIGEHGSWNREPLSGYKVVFVPFGENGFPAAGAKPVDVLTGFLTKDEKAQGRPVGVITDKAGALLVADDVGNVIWRVRAG
ncbi:PQQ-dependent sugar dehydrogenase [Sphingomonas aracearum]|uniref:Sorbosone dehydrogenase family protein n=1 Tax=Sphingomonas aracearum TaxID=2283317 RepID=A0A369W0V2_9SPHN|nr:sorbosone dehydrogenase family protein [Sphingomonas aracearum]RDE06922.1 sorbosone dehydrogenase family protein [Sphingomonas aracearum]